MVNKLRFPRKNKINPSREINDTNQSEKTIKKDDKQSGKPKDKEDKNKQHGMPNDKEGRKKRKGKKKKKKNSNKYNKRKTTNVGIDVWVKVTPYINWIIKVVFHGNDDLVYQRPINSFHYEW